MDMFLAHSAEGSDDPHNVFPQHSTGRNTYILVGNTSRAYTRMGIGGGVNQGNISAYDRSPRTYVFL
jgi:hypothetical protein